MVLSTTFPPLLTRWGRETSPDSLFSPRGHVIPLRSHVIHVGTWGLSGDLQRSPRDPIELGEPQLFHPPTLLLADPSPMRSRIIIPFPVKCGLQRRQVTPSRESESPLHDSRRRIHNRCGYARCGRLAFLAIPCRLSKCDVMIQGAM